MKKIILFLFVVSICSAVSAKNKNVVYDNNTKEVVAIKISQRPATEAGRIDIVCEGKTTLYGVNTSRALTMAVDENAIPADIKTKAYKIDTDKKEIYEEVILEEIK